ncbi:MAG: ABC transporter substrate-binding protein [Rhabdochlamydiaceae bacterium]|nr:ABC transporter substrate-binding protein [Rhabdochlamydiaceae bacterium]
MRIFFLFFMALALCGWADAPQQPPIKIGMSTVLTGPTQELGIQMKLGIEVYFAKINAQGGIAGRRIELIALDDRYEPTRAGPNMRKLIDEEGVLAVIGNVGAPTAVVSVPIANEKQVLLFGAFTGSEVLRKVPPDRYVINLRASYAEETAAMVNGLLSIGMKPDEIAFFTQNDAYGDSGYEGALKAIRAAGYPVEDLPQARYTRNTTNIEEGLAELLAASKPPKAIIIVGTYAPAEKFIKAAQKEFPDTLFLNVSFVGSDKLAQDLGDSADQVIVTEVVPFLNQDLPASKEYRKDLKQYGGAQAVPNFVSFEGFLTAKLFVIGLQRAAAKNQLTREGIIDAFEGMRDVDIGIGVNVSFDQTDHQGLHTVWPMILIHGKYETLNWKDLQRK